MKFPNGTHHYIMKGNVSINLEGKEKWDSRKEAELAIQSFLKG